MSTRNAASQATAPATLVPAQLLHDLRSPLNQIIGYSEMLTEDATTEVARDLTRIGSAGRRILELMEANFMATDAPLAAAPRRALTDAAPRLQSRAGATMGGGMLLVVDDDEMNRDVLSRRLTQQGHEVRTASSGSEALRHLRDKPFDLVLLDIMMPDMDGYAVLGHIKSDEALQHVPVIMISALSEVQSVVRCIDAGAEDYLTKPFDPTLLRARVGAALEKKRGRDRESALLAEVQSNYTRLQELEKLRDDMRNMIVHDLRTPLTSVIVGVEMLEKHGDLNDLQRQMMTIALGGGKTLLGMINDLLDVEKMESGSSNLQYGDVVPSTLVALAIEQLAPLAELGQTTLVSEVASDLPAFRGDDAKLSRTLVNLVANAIRFTRDGTVTIVVAHDTPASIRFAVRDTGAGIPEEAFERIFEKFGQLDTTSRVGTGLGLAFCKLAVEAHGGSIQVESTPGAGSTFSFSLPLVGPE